MIGAVLLWCLSSGRILELGLLMAVQTCKLQCSPIELDEMEDLFYSQVELEQVYFKIRSHTCMDGSSVDTVTNTLLYFF